MPGTSTGAPAKLEKITAPNGSDLKQLEIQYNNTVTDIQNMALAGLVDVVFGWSSAISASGQALGRGSTDTNIGSGAFRFIITGQAASEAKAAVAAGTAISAQTVPANKWASYALDVATGGTITVTAAAANTTGYDTEAAAIAAVPYPVTAKARMGFITVLASASTWIAATDALAGGASGNPATTTNYYPFDGIFAPTGLALNGNGVVALGGAGVVNGAAATGTGAAWNGGRNGPIIPTVLSRGSTDTRVALTAFTFNCNGICNIAKGAVAAGAAFGALGTIPAGKWGIIGMLINTAGTQSFISGPSNYTTGYAGEADAINDLANMYPTSTFGSQVAFFGYVTIKTASGQPFIVGTDALAGGASGNPASATNYYPVAGLTAVGTGFYQAGQSAARIASRNNKTLTAANY